MEDADSVVIAGTDVGGGTKDCVSTGVGTGPDTEAVQEVCDRFLGTVGGAAWWEGMG